MTSTLKILSFVALYLCFASADEGASDILILERLLHNYNATQPPLPDKPTEVKIGMYINSFYGISEKNMDYSISFYLRMSWQDPRLKFNIKREQIRGDDNIWNKIWTPDLFFRNEKEAKTFSVLRPQRLLKINATGHVWYVVKISAVMSCPMKLQKFPMDTQACPIMFESFGYTMDTIYFQWLEKPVDVDKEVALPEFTLTDLILYDCSQNYTAGAFPCLEVRFILRRDVGYFILQVFLPSIIVVLVSWLQFWLQPDATTSRVLLGLFCTFILITQMTGLKSTLPKVSYITALDVWMFSCLMFVVFSLLEFGIVHFSNREGVENSVLLKVKENIDVVSRVSFPVSFLLMVIIYFSLYTKPTE